MNAEKKVIVQQKIIDDFNEEKAALIKKIKELEGSTQEEKNKCEEAVQYANDVLFNVEQYLYDFENIVSEMKMYKSKYLEILDTLNVVQRRYERELEDLIESFKNIDSCVNDKYNKSLIDRIKRKK